MLFGDDKPARPKYSWEEPSPASPAAPVVQPVVDKSEDVASSSSSSYQSILDAPTDIVSAVARTEEPAPPSQQHLDTSWENVFSASAHEDREESPLNVAAPAVPISVEKMSTADTGAQENFGAWSSLKALDDNPFWKKTDDSLSSASAAIDSNLAATAPTPKDTDWSSLANGGLWGASASLSADDFQTSTKKVASAPAVVDSDAVHAMTDLLKDNSLLQKSKRGMVSIKLHRVK